MLIGSFCLATAVSAQTPTIEKTVPPTQVKANHSVPKKRSKTPTKPASTLTADQAKTTNAPQETSHWTKEWIAKYVIVTPKSGYTHALIDVENLRPTFDGPGMHAAAAKEALSLAQSAGLLDPTSDLVKVDVVVFLNRDNYGAPVWDSMKRYAHLEFSTQALAKNTAAVFQKPEAEWTGSFKSVTFY